MNAEICYVDDTFYPEMATDNIYYINIKPYLHSLPFNEIYKRFLESNIGKRLIDKEAMNYFIYFMKKKIQLSNFMVIKKK
jgi:hypothetical protein